MSGGQFVPLNAHMFLPSVYGGIGHPPDPTPKTDADNRADIDRVFAGRFPGSANAALRQSYAGLYDNPTLVSKVPSGNLRGALVMLKGTIAESTIDAVLSSAVRDITFSTQTPACCVAVVKVNADSSASVLFAPAYANERAAVLTSIVGHELLHGNDELDSYEEQLVDKYLDSIVYAQQARDFHRQGQPSLPQNPTKLTQQNNTFLLAVLNSRTGGHLHIHDSDGSVLMPGSTRPDLRQFADVFTAEIIGNPTPGNHLLADALRRLVAKPDAVAEDGDWGDAIDVIDAQNLNPASLDACDVRVVAIDALNTYQTP